MERGSYTEEEIPIYVSEILSLVKEKNIHTILLSGDLGSGKTTFIKEIGRQLGINENIVSPTYILLKRYETQDQLFKEMIHIDAYRIEDDYTWNVLKLDNILSQSSTITCIEWPEKISKIFEYPHMFLEFKHIDNTRRSLKYTL